MVSDLYEKLAKVQWLVRKQQMRGWITGGPMADTTRGQGRIIAILQLRDDISTKDLSYLLGVRTSSLNELLAKLEKNGYVSREPSEQDKRVMLVKLTEKGKNEKVPEPSDFDDIFSCLSGDEQDIFGEYLDRLITALRANIGDEASARMEAIRSRFGDIDAFFGEHRRELHRRQCFAHDPYLVFGHRSRHFRHDIISEHRHRHEHSCCHGEHGHGYNRCGREDK